MSKLKAVILLGVVLLIVGLVGATVCFPLAVSDGVEMVNEVLEEGDMVNRQQIGTADTTTLVIDYLEITMQLRQSEDDNIYIQTANNGFQPLVVNSRQEGEELHVSVEASPVTHISIESIKQSLAFGVSGQSRLVLYIPKNISLKAEEGAGYSIYSYGLVEFANKEEFFQSQENWDDSAEALQYRIEDIQNQLLSYQQDAVYQSYGSASLDNWYQQETESLYTQLKDMRIRLLRQQLPEETDLETQNEAVFVLSQLCDLQQQQDLLALQESIVFYAYSVEGTIGENVYLQRHEEIEEQMDEITPQIEQLQQQLDAYVYNYTLPEDSTSSQPSGQPQTDPAGQADQADPANPADPAPSGVTAA